MNQESEEVVTSLMKYFLASVVEHQLISSNQIWESYYYFYDEYHGNIEGGCRLPGFTPNKEESVVGLVLIAVLSAFEKIPCNASEVLESEILETVIGLQK